MWFFLSLFFFRFAKDYSFLTFNGSCLSWFIPPDAMSSSSIFPEKINKRIYVKITSKNMFAKTPLGGAVHDYKTKNINPFFLLLLWDVIVTCHVGLSGEIYVPGQPTTKFQCNHVAHTRIHSLTTKLINIFSTFFSVIYIRLNVIFFFVRYILRYIKHMNKKTPRWYLFLLKMLKSFDLKVFILISNKT